jgi:hypothetical protein
MLRFLVMVLAAAGCIAGGSVGAVVGVSAELRWPLSEANFEDALRRGIAMGVVGAGVAALLLAAAPRPKLWWLGCLGAGVTLLLSCAIMWWNVIRSLG